MEVQDICINVAAGSRCGGDWMVRSHWSAAACCLAVVDFLTLIVSFASMASYPNGYPNFSSAYARSLD